MADGPPVLDPQDLTWNEIEEFEELTGISFANGNVALRAKDLKVLAYLVLRRDQPDLTLADMGRIRLKDSLAVGRVDPTEAGA